jgi:oligopeptidase A
VPEGVSKEDAQAEATDRFNEINLLLSNLTNSFSNNLMDSTAAFKRLITDKTGMAGLPDSFLGQAAQQVGFSAVHAA